MFERYTEKARRVIFFARYEASQFGSPYIETEHILLGLVREDKVLTHRFLREQNVAEGIRRQIESATMVREKVSTSVDLPVSNECKRVLAYAAEEAERLSHKHIGTEHLFLGLLREEKSFAAQILHERGVRISFVRETLAQAPHEGVAAHREETSKLPTEFGTFLTKLALEKSLLPCIGRDKEIEQVMHILGRSSKNNVVLIGELGVGKRTIAEGVVQRVADNMGPVFLHEKRFAAIDLASLVASSERKARSAGSSDPANAELAAWGADTIFVLDELHWLLASGPDLGAQGVTLLLKSALLEGTVRCIALATPEEYHAAIKKAPWLERCFRAVEVAPASQDETLQILQAIKGRFEKFHSVLYTDEALKVAVAYSVRFVKNRPLPDKAIDLIDDAGTYVKMKYVDKIPPEIVEAERRLKFIGHRMEDAIADHEFDKARFYSDEMRKEREALEALRKKFQIEIGQEATVTPEHIEEVLAGWIGVPVTSIRAKGSEDADSKKQGGNTGGQKQE